MLAQWLFNGCSMVVQWLAKGCHHALWSLVSAESMNAAVAAVSVSSPMSFVFWGLRLEFIGVVVFPGRRGNFLPRRGKFSPRRGKKSGCLVRWCVREGVWMSSETFFLSFLDYGVFYKLRDKERSKESAYVLVDFLARPFVSCVSRIARYHRRLWRTMASDEASERRTGNCGSWGKPDLICPLFRHLCKYLKEKKVYSTFFGTLYRIT